MSYMSPTYGKVDFNAIPEGLLAFYERNRKFARPFSIVVGTDSQNFDYTKSVTVVAMVCEGHGGVFYYEVSKVPLMRDVRSKLYAETQSSLETIMELISLLEGDARYAEMYRSCPMSIHVDAGNSPNGKTAELIPEITGWVRSLGYDCRVKPESFVASSVADKISK